MYVIVGLGNPGFRYAKTRHNTGFMVIDMLAKRFGISIDREKCRAAVGEGYIGEEQVVLAKPQTYMNNSGESVLDLKMEYGVEAQKIIVIYDDIDLDLGVLRIRAFGSAGTHNGMRSVVYHLQTENFPRVRVGIGRPPEGQDLVGYVLSPFADEEIPVLLEVCERAVKGIELIVTEGITLAMSRCNG